MPGRVASGRTARKTTSAKSLRSARNSSPVAELPDEGEDTTLRHAICGVFADAQKSTAGHRKAIITLRKIQETCCYEPTSTKKGKRNDEFEEEDFNREVVRIVLRILPVRKAEPVGDRVIRFLGTFLSVASGKDNEIYEASGEVEEDTLPETPTSRLTTQILSELLRMIQAKDKTIRFRATQIMSHVINSLDTLDDSLFHRLRFALLKRIHDKEAPVRLQAVYGLGRLAAEVDDDEEEGSDSDDDVRGGVLNKLLQVLQNDPSAEVRRNLLLNLPLTKEVLPYLLERARDADATTRRALYGRLLPALGDFRHLSMTHREKLLRWGLRDRDENVRKATAQLFSQRWIEDCAALPAAQVEEGVEADKQKVAVPSLDALLELLERIDLVNSGREGGIALIAMHEFWSGRPDYLDYVSFPDEFWEDLSPELAFVARTFNDFCRTATKEDYVGPKSLEVLVDDKLPEVTRFGFLLQREIQKLVEATMLSHEAGEDDADAQQDVDYREFVVEQMLHTALTFDYSDEVGRQKMFDLTRRALGQPDLPEEVTRLLVEVLRLVCGENAKGEREFCGVVLEAIAEVHDTIMGDDETEGDSSTVDSFHSATEQVDGDDDDTAVAAQKNSKKKAQKETDPEAAAEKAIKEIMVNMKCLHIALCMLQNVQCDLEENVHLVTMLNNLVVPAVRSQEAPIRERGLLCLGLCCLLGKNLAQENLTLFLHCFAKGHPELQAIALQIITDILITHPTLLSDDTTTLNDQSESQNEYMRPLVKAFKSSLKSDHPEVQATGATALAKAMLSRLITDTDLLKALVVAYFDPDNQNNPQFRQTLTYFLPVYCHSRAENAMRMVEVVIPVMQRLGQLKDLEDADVEEEPTGETMVKMAKIGEMLLDWTDPRRIFGFADATESVGKAHGANEIHFVLAENILDRLVTAGKIAKDEKKVFFSMLNKLHLPPNGADAERVKTILELATEAVETKAAPTATDRNVLTKLQNNLIKMMHDVMTDERGGGGVEETVLDTTEVDGNNVDDESVVEGDGDTTVHVRPGAADDDNVDESISQLQAELRDATLGATTTGFVPDAEGTRIGLSDDGDTEMMDADD
ncbi:hypothetical protein DOTSEDRAFT_173713 [Dothistroma septosporum NZE10]|uniref:Nuclear condensin complex subunit 3 C-terminal domain-containing protein n=1 Tax=Dothistroma septosporum (strain NZE10 / CBS 128990) TaxID=675120 RepID=M2XKP8_DOTSN|nr:hypothetical protein DOTSEDRAFT_173713 [Dothistroma septosporum NZE10]